MHLQVRVFTDLCLSLSAVFAVLLVEYVTSVEGMAFVFYVCMSYCMSVDNYVCHGTPFHCVTNSVCRCIPYGSATQSLL